MEKVIPPETQLHKSAVVLCSQANLFSTWLTYTSPKSEAGNMLDVSPPFLSARINSNLCLFLRRQKEHTRQKPNVRRSSFSVSARVPGPDIIKYRYLKVRTIPFKVVQRIRLTLLSLI